MEVQVTARGHVSPTLERIAQEKVGALDRLVKGGILQARVVLTQEANPRLDRPARAEGEIDLQGRPVRARVAAPTMDRAVDELAERLHSQLRRHVDRLMTRQRRPVASAAGEWRHGDWAPPRPDRYPRRAGQREIVRRKSFAVGEMDVAEAAAELDALDHDFFLFRDTGTGEDAVLHRRDDGRLGVIDSPGVSRPQEAEGPVYEPSRMSGPMELSDAVAEMDELDHRFLFFVDARTGRGAVIYLRYDGHYGLIEPAR